jgi:hypothetical protein
MMMPDSSLPLSIFAGKPKTPIILFVMILNLLILSEKYHNRATKYQSFPSGGWGKQQLTTQ